MTMTPLRTPLFPVKKRNETKVSQLIGYLCKTYKLLTLQFRCVHQMYQYRCHQMPNSFLLLIWQMLDQYASTPSHFWFSLNFNGRGYTFTRLCQGYWESPTNHNEALRRSLVPLLLTPGTTQLQYIDDLMVCSPTKEQYEKDIVKLLQHFAAEGHKARLSKTQFAQQQVTVLVHVIIGEGKSLSAKQVEAIQKKFKTSYKEITVVGMCSYCCKFIPNYAILEAPLSALAYGKGL